jgi:RecA/RadA recombinase
MSILETNADLLKTKLIMHSALEQFSMQGSSLKMSIGSGELDSLVDGIQEGLFYLFYGDSKPLDGLFHQLLVNCILSVKEHGFESAAVCVNNTDYYGRGKMILNPEKVANTAKAAGIDPKIVAKNLFIQTAYDSQHQVQIAKEVGQLLEDNHDIKLVVINNLTKFFRDSNVRQRSEIANNVKEVISIINRACAKNKVAIVATGDSNVCSRGIIPRPVGGTYLKHLANVIMHVKDISNSTFMPRFKATLVKHQYSKTPKSVIVHGRRVRGMTLLN